VSVTAAKSAVTGAHLSRLRRACRISTSRLRLPARR
jgi:hypothetical protein